MNKAKIITKEQLELKRAARNGCVSCGKQTNMEKQENNPQPILPSRIEMIKNLAQAAKEAIQNGLDVRSPEDIEKALTICAECPHIIDEGPRCGVCGCYLKYKTSLKAWHCPIGKW